jgi:N-acetylmuramoyl-L-alanine amidase
MPRYLFKEILSQHFTATVKERKPDRIVLHYTATATLQDALAALGARGLSVHYLIGRAPGELVCQVPPRHIAWHAKGVNTRSVGIEIVNLGGMMPRAGKMYQPDGKGGFYQVTPQGQVMLFKRNGFGAWECFTNWQYEAVAQLCAWLLWRFPSIRDDGIIGHEEVSPGIKSDPGPAWMWDTFRQGLSNWGGKKVGLDSPDVLFLG